MAKDFFIDVNPEEPETPQPPMHDEEVAVPIRSRPPQPPAPTGRSIRNVNIAARRIVPASRPPVNVRPDPGQGSVRPRSKRRFGLLIAAAAVLLLVTAATVYVFWGGTTITVTPRVHQVAFDGSTQFTAYPASSATAGMLSYRVETVTLEDSQNVRASGTEKAADRASGTITVYNNYSEDSVRLIKNTRFQTPDGLVFRTPASIEVPGKSAGTPGQITTEVIADEPGPSYNISPTDKFTLPGLKGTADMFANVYAKSNTAFSGGFVGDRPSVSQGDMDAAKSQIRDRLLEKAKEALQPFNSGTTFAFSELMNISFESLPTTSGGSDGAVVNERAVVSIPVFDASTFAQSIAGAVSADASGSSVTFSPSQGFTIRPATEAQGVGQDPISFVLDGSASLVWNVDVNALREALAGRDQGAFETVIGSFSGVEKAEARIVPFWKTRFPNEATDITVTVESALPVQP